MARKFPVMPTALNKALAAFLTGAASGAITALVMGVVGTVSRSLWGDSTEQGLDYVVPLGWSMGVCGAIGVLLALIHRGGKKTLLPELHATMHELHHPEDAPPRDNPRALLGAMVALIGGGVSGPEALMSRLAALSSQRIWRGRDQDYAKASVAGSLAMFGSPLLGGAVVHDQRADRIQRWLPGIIGGLAGFSLFHGIDEVTGGTLRALPYTWPSNLGEDIGTLVSALLAGLVGGALGLMLRSWRRALQQRELLEHWRWWPVLTGLLLGALMHWLPLVPFAGEDQLRPLLEGVNRTDAPMLIFSALIKLLMLGLCLETGWRGGIFFPLFLIACAVGVGLHDLWPGLGSLGSWCGGITGAIYLTVLRSPLVALILGLGLLQGHGATGVMVGVAVAWLITHRSPPGDGPPPAQQTPDSPGCPEPQW